MGRPNVVSPSRNKEAHGSIAWAKCQDFNNRRVGVVESFAGCSCCCVSSSSSRSPLSRGPMCLFLEFAACVKRLVSRFVCWCFADARVWPPITTDSKIGVLAVAL